MVVTISHILVKRYIHVEIENLKIALKLLQTLIKTEQILV